MNAERMLKIRELVEDVEDFDRLRFEIAARIDLLHDEEEAERLLGPDRAPLFALRDAHEHLTGIEIFPVMKNLNRAIGTDRKEPNEALSKIRREAGRKGSEAARAKKSTAAVDGA